MKMLCQDPKKRPNMDQLKQDPFFSGIDWSLLEQKKLAPTVVLKKPPPKEEQKSSTEGADDEVSMMFQEGCILKGHTAGQSILIDTDYDESNKSYNRVRNYSFERQ